MRALAAVLVVAGTLGLAACHRGESPLEPDRTAAANPQGPKNAGGGLNGGLGQNSTNKMGASGTGLTGSFPSASSPAVSDGSTNSTTKSSVGNR
jgi:hypothetical protein